MDLPHESRRRHRRVSFHAPVVIRACDDRVGLEARARNISEGGLYLSAREPIAAGTTLWCEIAIDGVRHHLRARVAWVHQDGPGNPIALGLAFQELSGAHTAALRLLVTSQPPPAERSRVWFDGISNAIVGQTELFERGAVLRAPLPFLELGRAVRIEDSTTEPRTRSGRIASITLASDGDSPVPYLRVEFSLDPAPDDSESLRARSGPPTLVTRDPDRAAQRAPWRRRAAVGGVLACVGGALVAALAAGPRAGDATVATLAGSASRVAAPALHPRGVARSAAVSEPAARTTRAEGVATMASVSASPHTADASPHTADASTHTADASTHIADASTPRLAAAPPAPAGPLLRFGDVTEIVIPVVGRATEAADYPLDDPPGLAINVPRASVAFPHGDTHVDQGGVRYVRVVRRGDGIQIRLHFTGRTPRPYDVALAADRVTITVRAPAPQSQR